MSDLLGVMAAGERNIDRLGDPDNLRRDAMWIAEVAAEHGATRLLAATAAAERVVGAALMAVPGLQGAGATTHFEADETCLVVDVNLASGTSLAHAARHARRSGATHVLAAVLNVLTPAAATAADCGVDGLVVLANGRRP